MKETDCKWSMRASIVYAIVFMLLLASYCVSESHADTNLNMWALFGESAPTYSNVYAGDFVDVGNDVYYFYYLDGLSDGPTSTHWPYNQQYDRIMGRVVDLSSGSPVVSNEVLILDRYNQELINAVNADSGCAIQHIGDPSVLKETNGSTGQPYWIMFFTLKIDDPSTNGQADQWDNQTWSMVSTDGYNWILPVRTIPGDAGRGLSCPTAVRYEMGGYDWAVVVDNRYMNDGLYVIQVDGATRKARTYPLKAIDSQGIIYCNPSMVFDGSKYQLFFNTFEGLATLPAHTPPWDRPVDDTTAKNVQIYKVSGYSPLSFSNSTKENIVDVSGSNSVNAAMAPGVEWLGNGEYLLSMSMIDGVDTYPATGWGDWMCHRWVQMWKMHD